MLLIKTMWSDISLFPVLLQSKHFGRMEFYINLREGAGISLVEFQLLKNQKATPVRTRTGCRVLQTWNQVLTLQLACWLCCLGRAYNPLNLSFIPFEKELIDLSISLIVRNACNVCQEPFSGTVIGWDSTGTDCFTSSFRHHLVHSLPLSDKSLQRRLQFQNSFR